MVVALFHRAEGMGVHARLPAEAEEGEGGGQQLCQQLIPMHGRSPIFRPCISRANRPSSAPHPPAVSVPQISSSSGGSSSPYTSDSLCPAPSSKTIPQSSVPPRPPLQPLSAEPSTHLQPLFQTRSSSGGPLLDQLPHPQLPTHLQPLLHNRQQQRQQLIAIHQ